MVKVSVVMPAYNREDYILEAIESILNQTFQDFELIVLDDRSTDRTIEVVEGIGDPRIRLIPMPCKTSVPILRGYGIDLAQGEYVAFMDSDDRSALNRFALQVDYLDTHPEVGVVSGNYQFFGTFDKFYEMPKTHEEIKHALLYRSPITNGACMMRRSILTDHGIQFRPEYFVCEDYALWVDMIPYTQMRNLDATLLYVRAHDKQITAQSWRDSSQLRLRRAILGEIHRSALKALNLELSEEDMEIYNLAVGESSSSYKSKPDVADLRRVFQSLLTQAEQDPELDSELLRPIYERELKRYEEG